MKFVILLVVLVAVELASTEKYSAKEKKAIKYMEQYGYLPGSVDVNMVSRGQFERGMKKFQSNFHLPDTGSLDQGTVSQMEKPRCGDKDEDPGDNTDEDGQLRRKREISLNNKVPNWNTKPIAWGVCPSSLNSSLFCSRSSEVSFADAEQVFEEALDMWASMTKSLTFVKDSCSNEPIIKITCVEEDCHPEDPYCFTSGVLAHAFYPAQSSNISSDAHFRNQVWNWHVGHATGFFDIVGVAIHELGHNLGLGHSTLTGNVMYPSISSSGGSTSGDTSGYTGYDDILYMQANYDKSPFCEFNTNLNAVLVDGQGRMIFFKGDYFMELKSNNFIGLPQKIANVPGLPSSSSYDAAVYMPDVLGSNGQVLYPKRILIFKGRKVYQMQGTDKFSDVENGLNSFTQMSKTERNNLIKRFPKDVGSVFSSIPAKYLYATKGTTLYRKEIGSNSSPTKSTIAFTVTAAATDSNNNQVLFTSDNKYCNVPSTSAQVTLPSSCAEAAPQYWFKMCVPP